METKETRLKRKEAIQTGQTALGIELGSTRIKAVLIDHNYEPIAAGSYDWENQLENGIWTYSLDEIWKGLQTSYQKLAAVVSEEYDTPLTTIGAIGFSAMMHGYLAFDQEDELLVPFRTWRNAITAEAEEKLSQAFQYTIPQRWSIAHLYQAILNKEAHVNDLSYFTTLAGYIHWQLTGQKVLGVGDASGMFPIDPQTKRYDAEKLAIFDRLAKTEGFLQPVETLLPEIRLAGEVAGTLTEKGARLLDRSRQLEAGIPICPPEGDAGTGMVATNSVGLRTGNVSAGTSAFAMIVLDKELVNVHPEIDQVTTPDGSPVAMVHTNNCSSEINAWVKIFKEFSESLGVTTDSQQIYETLFSKALQADVDCGGLLSFGYHSGENITKMEQGRPLFVRRPDSKFDLANFMRMHLSSAFGAMRLGMEILKSEKITIDRLVAHGGIFKTPKAAQTILASAMEAPVTVMETAGEGGAWGIALLAAYLQKAETMSLEEFLAQHVFLNSEGITIKPTEADLKGYERFIALYERGLPIEASAIVSMEEGVKKC
ncbi:MULTISPECIES: FGGY-family carbohydrate kinase [unclassified Enterococcus]|uniref:xylulokinase n=1 Tax=unclassified Enterococcus TaxID=2608891 RepID=UPI001A9312A1|nr:FGGY-family carbohydrate kinase [Enterococcus sp. DIV1298c]MBO1301101.1 FGGY-family carbohydrate kinase [Enterococcus sp. DIV1271a]